MKKLGAFLMALVVPFATAGVLLLGQHVFFERPRHQLERELQRNVQDIKQNSRRLVRKLERSIDQNRRATNRQLRIILRCIRTGDCENPEVTRASSGSSEGGGTQPVPRGAEPKPKRQPNPPPRPSPRPSPKPSPKPSPTCVNVVITEVCI